MIRIDTIWLALGASDLRCGMDSLLGTVLHEFGAAQKHHAYVFANKSATRLKVLIYDGAGLWLCARRLQAGRFAWPKDATGQVTLTPEQWEWLIAGAPWQRLDTPACIDVM